MEPLAAFKFWPQTLRATHGILNDLRAVASCRIVGSVSKLQIASLLLLIGACRHASG